MKYKVYLQCKLIAFKLITDPATLHKRTVTISLNTIKLYTVTVGNTVFT